MKPILFVEVSSAGTGNNTAIGMYGGSLRWCSATSSTANWYTGFIDATTVDGVARAMNISQGGGLGGFTGSVQIAALKAELVTAFAAGTISLVGKTVRIYWSLTDDFADAVLRYTGKVSAPRADDEITLVLECENALAYDAATIKAITVTPEMALSQPNNEAVGKTISPVYGNVCLFPMIHVSAESVLHAALVSSGTGSDFSGNAPHIDDTGVWYSQVVTRSGDKYKGMSLLMVKHIYQAVANETPVWVGLSYSGDVYFFQSGAEQKLDTVRRLYVGEYLNIVRGGGSGSSYRILDAIWDGTLRTVLLQVDTTDAQAFTASGTTSDYSIDKSSFYGNPISDPLFTDVTEEQTSMVSFTASSDIYLVAADADTSAGEIWTTDDAGNYYKVFDIPADTLVLYETPQYKMVRMSVDRKYRETAEEFITTTLVVTPSYYRENGIGTADTQYNCAQLALNAILDNPWASDGVTNGQDVTHTTNGPTWVQPEPAIKAGRPSSRTVYYTPIEDLIGGVDISNNTAVSLVPRFTYSFVGASDSTYYVFLTVRITVAAMSEGNVVMGKAVFERQIKYHAPLASGLVYLSVDPLTQSVTLSNAVDYGDSAPELYDAIKAALDLTSILACDSSRKVRYLYTTIFLESNNPDVDILYTSVDMSRSVYNPSISISHTVKKDALAIRSVSDAAINTPADIAKAICDSTGIATDATSFSSASSQQLALYTTGFAFDGQLRTNGATVVSDILAGLASKTMTAFYSDTAGVLRAAFIPFTVTPSLTVSDIIKGSLSISKPNSGYQYTAYDFTVKLPASPESGVFVNTDPVVEYFPGPDETEAHGTVYSAGNGWALSTKAVREFTPVHATQTCALLDMSITKETQDKSVFYAFVEGTTWRLTCSGGVQITARLDCVSIYPPDDPDRTGIRVGFYLLNYPAGITSTTVYSLQLYGPNPTWRGYVSGAFGLDYEIAKTMWQSAQDARLQLGSDQKLAETYTKLDEPVWGSDALALSNWMAATVAHGTKTKTVLQFRMPATDDTLALTLMDAVTFAWGPFAAAPVVGQVVELSDGYQANEVAVTLLVTAEPPATDYLQDVPLSEDPTGYLQNVPLSNDPVNYLQDVPL